MPDVDVERLGKQPPGKKRMAGKAGRFKMLQSIFNTFEIFSNHICRNPSGCVFSPSLPSLVSLDLRRVASVRSVCPGHWLPWWSIQADGHGPPDGFD